MIASFMQCSPTSEILAIYIGTLLQQFYNLFFVTSNGRSMERGLTAIVALIQFVVQSTLLNFIFSQDNEFKVKYWIRVLGDLKFNDKMTAKWLDFVIKLWTKKICICSCRICPKNIWNATWPSTIVHLQVMWYVYKVMHYNMVYEMYSFLVVRNGYNNKWKRIITGSLSFWRI